MSEQVQYRGRRLDAASDATDPVQFGFPALALGVADFGSDRWLYLHFAAEELDGEAQGLIAGHATPLTPGDPIILPVPLEPTAWRVSLTGEASKSVDIVTSRKPVVTVDRIGLDLNVGTTTADIDGGVFVRVDSADTGSRMHGRALSEPPTSPTHTVPNRPGIYDGIAIGRDRVYRISVLAGMAFSAVDLDMGAAVPAVYVPPTVVPAYEKPDGRLDSGRDYRML